MLPSRVIRPTEKTIYNLGNTIIKRLFHQKYRGNIIRYNQDDITRLLNFVSMNSTFIPQNIQTPWGDAIKTISLGSKTALHQIGTRGTTTQQHNKEAIVSSFIVLDENKNIVNKKLLRNIIPHRSRNGGNKFINKCYNIRKEFNDGHSDLLCKITNYKRESYVFGTSLQL